MKRYINSLFILFLSLTVSYSQDAVKSKEFYLDISSYPKRVFTGQKFDIKLKATILKPKESYDRIILSYANGKNIDIINKEPEWIQQKDNIFFTKLTFKTQDTAFTLPKITVALVKEEQIIDFLSLKLPEITFEKIAVNEELFSNIIAKELQVLTVKTKQYNNNTLHTTINLEGLNSNLEDIHLKSYGEQGIKSFDEKYPLQNIFFYVMTPSHIKQITFTYYNTLSKDFVTVNIPVNLEEELVSTQTDLNPYNSSMLLYKQSLSVFFLLLFLVIFIVTKKERYLIFVIVSILATVYFFIPNKKVVLTKGTDIYILPTNNSTIYKKLEKRELAEVINEKGQFRKVLFENKNIGWIKENDIK